MLGLRFSRLVHAAIASGALVLGACPAGSQDTDADTDTTSGTSSSGDTTDDPTTGLPPPPPPPPPADVTPPALAAVEFQDPATLKLTFTEPIAPTDDVNPKRFRLSFAFGYYGNYGLPPTTTLADPHYYNVIQVCVPAPPGCYYDPPPYYCYYGPFCYYAPSAPIHIVDVVKSATEPNVAFLALSVPIQPTMCELLQKFPSGNLATVLHLHYADGGQAQITDLAGLPLPPLAEAWVTEDDQFYEYYDQPAPFANFNPFLPIPCPF